MIGMMILTFVLFFAFVVNTGMLVNAKINLQNAADLAAYAGASVQGRQLNTVSFLNYEMRRQYKKFLFRYYVLGNLAQDSHPGVPGQPRQWRPYKLSPIDYQVPAVCIIFNAKDNFCHIDPGNGLQAIRIPPETLLDQINNTVRSQLKNIEKLRRTNCAGIGRTNIQLLMLWLYNTDPRFENLNGVDVADESLLRLIKGAADGLGLVPRELLLLQRIKTMAKMINAPPEKLNLEKAQAYQDSGRAEVERQVAAFMSAYETLGQNVFDPNSVTLDEIGPSGESPYFAYEPIKAAFDAWAVDFNVLVNGQYLSADSKAVQDLPDTAPANCRPVLTPITLNNGVPLGIKKSPEKLTYYALRLEAEAKTMFSPFGDMRLRAYSAAAPYGSRIGPQATDDEFLRKGQEPPADFRAGSIVNLKKNIPNLRVAADDDIQSLGWNNGALIEAMFQPLGGTYADKITSDDIQRGYQAAMVPNPAESGLYNMLPTNNWADTTIKYFDTRLEYAMWAPLFAEGQQGAEEDLKQTVEEILQEPPFAQGDTDKDRGTKLRAYIRESLGKYIEKVRAGQGEEGDGLNVLRVPDPFKGRPLQAGTTPTELINLPEKFMIRTPQAAKTSWNKEDDSNGRTGYSVKFISFDSLLGGKIVTGLRHPRFPAAAVPATNVPYRDPIAEGDLDPTVFKH